MTFGVIPGRAEGANPESRHKLGASFWIPDRRFAASGMTMLGTVCHLSRHARA